MDAECGFARTTEERHVDEGGNEETNNTNKCLSSINGHNRMNEKEAIPIWTRHSSNTLAVRQIRLISVGHNCPSIHHTWSLLLLN